MKTTRCIALVIALIFWAPAFAHAQNKIPVYHQEIETMCAGDASLQEALESAPSDKRFKLWSRAMKRTVSSPEGRGLLKKIRSAQTEERCALLVEAAQRNEIKLNLSRCKTLCSAMDIIKLGAQLSEETPITGLAGFNGNGEGGGPVEGGFGMQGPGVGTPDGPTSGDDPNVRRGVLKPARFEVTGDYEKRTIKKIIRQHSQSLISCYEREIKKDPKIKGSLTIAWQINTSGTVAGARVVADEIGNKALSNCLITTITRWRFPAPTSARPARVKYPFRFELK